MRSRVLQTLGLGGGLVLTGFLAWYGAMQLALEKDRVAVPRVIGMEAVAATQRLQEEGFQPVITSEEYSDRAPVGAVVSQRPPSGIRARKGGDVRLTVSKGGDVLLLPTLMGGPLTRARRILVDGGLLLGRVTQIHSAEYPAGDVIAQDPPPGTPVRRGTAVDLLVSLGPEGSRGPGPERR